jgi:hypothetical protein
MQSIFKIFAKLLVVASVMFAGLTMAQSGPTVSEIYAKAQAGKLDEAPPGMMAEQQSEVVASGKTDMDEKVVRG